MHCFLEMFANPFLIAGFSAWCLAQLMKLLTSTVINRKFDIKRLFGDGGMPSGHAATVASLAAFTGMRFGLGSFEFALTLVFALVVCRDAMGVRHETGKQAILINQMIRSIEILTADRLPEVKLKEFVGHTPFQVLVGAVIGLMNALLISKII